MLVVIDRFEGDFAVCEKPDKTTLNIHTSKMPKGCKEGDVINIKGSQINIDVNETERRKYEIDKITKDIWE
ncbi:DUF3006 domain-containing protein [Clostridium sp. 19966]|uniref:DUF3006 domain-containing protein n=1 Tax=Clostridium sp. 19966 TaxID=2768166 RepID=UPI0028DDE925|nr:DUF3006 domain-containing protein [Clostridium sp. 19966]MDT8715530.1 DUF3006 domain-containing protein [Clostridium sp. 19966]